MVGLIEVIETVIYFILSLAGAVAGAASGVGSGIIIKPVIEIFSDMTIKQVNLFSCVAVFTMSLVAVVRQRKAMKDFEFRKGVPIGIGSIIGGTVGSFIFGMFKGDALAATQAVLQILVMIILLLHLIFEARLRSYKLERTITYLGLGVCLGAIAAFLGIGGGPLNLSALILFFSMNLKSAALYSMFIILFAQGANLIRWGVFTAEGFPKVPINSLIAVIVGSIAGALIGAAIYKKLNSKASKRLYAGVLIFIITATIVNLCLILFQIEYFK